MLFPHKILVIYLKFSKFIIKLFSQKILEVIQSMNDIYKTKKNVIFIFKLINYYNRKYNNQKMKLKYLY